jgi:hypothetical protein
MAQNPKRIRDFSNRRDDRILSVRNATFALCGPKYLRRRKQQPLPMFRAAIG